MSQQHFVIRLFSSILSITLFTAGAFAAGDPGSALVPAQSFRDLVAQVEQRANAQALDVSTVTDDDLSLIRILLPARTGQDLIHPGTGQVLTMEGLTRLKQSLTELIVLNHSLYQKIQALSNAIVGPGAKSVTRELQLGCTLVVVGGCRVALGLGIEDRGDSSRLVLGLNIMSFPARDSSHDYPGSGGAMVAIDFSAEQYQALQSRFVNNLQRDSGTWAIGVGRVQMSGSNGYMENAVMGGITLGLGGAGTSDSGYSRLSIPVFWLPFGWASGLTRMLKKQQQIFQSLASFRIEEALTRTQDLEREYTRLSRLATERGYTVKTTYSEVGTSPFASLRRFLQIVEERQSSASLCRTSIFKK